MPTFKDALGNEHNLQVNVHTLKKCLAETGKNLGKLFGDETQLLLNLRRDLLLCADCVASIVVASNPGIQIDRDALLRNLRGDSLANAQAALIEAVVDFQPEKYRVAVRQLLADLEVTEKAVVDEYLASVGGE